MKKIRDAQVIIGMLEHGDLAAQLTTDISETLSKLKERAAEGGKKAKAKGKITLTLDFEVDAAGATVVHAGIETKVPKAPRGESFFWVTEDGALSTEHPQQTDMFAGPRPTRERADA